MADCKPRSSPYEMDMRKTSDEIDLIDSKPYEIIGYLIYIIVALRPDISYRVTWLFQDQAKPNFFNLTKAKPVLSYFKGTISH